MTINSPKLSYKSKLVASGVKQVIEHTANLSSSWTPAVHGTSGVTIATAQSKSPSHPPAPDGLSASSASSA